MTAWTATLCCGSVNQTHGINLCVSPGPSVPLCLFVIFVDVGKTRRLRSPIIQNSHNPVWNQRATVYVADEADDITVEIKVCTWAGAAAGLEGCYIWSFCFAQVAAAVCLAITDPYLACVSAACCSGAAEPTLLALSSGTGGTGG